MENLRVLYCNSEKGNTLCTNLTRLQYKAVNEIRDNNYLVVRQADKGGSIVYLNVDFFASLVLAILNEQTTYHKLSFNPATVFKKPLKVLLQEGFSLGILT